MQHYRLAVPFDDVAPLTPQQVRAATGLAEPTKVEYVATLFDQSKWLDHPDWAGAVYPTQTSAYRHRGMTGVARQDFEIDGPSGSRQARHAVVVYGSEHIAKRVFVGQQRVSGQRVSANHEPVASPPGIPPGEHDYPGRRYDGAQ